jgi:predicted Rossmann-fold nucleotide-binding protein
LYKCIILSPLVRITFIIIEKVFFVQRLQAFYISLGGNYGTLLSAVLCWQNSKIHGRTARIIALRLYQIRAKPLQYNNYLYFTALQGVDLNKLIRNIDSIAMRKLLIYASFTKAT